MFYFVSQTSSSIEHNLETTALEHDLISLSVYTEYNIWVVAINHNGPGAATEEITVRTYGAAPSEPPHNITLEAVSSTVSYLSIIYFWDSL